MRKLTTYEIEQLHDAALKPTIKTPIVVVLENIRSLHNVGSIFRSADAFNIQKIFLCGITGIPPHREIQKTALGATETVDWEFYNHTQDCISNLKKDNYKIIAVEQTDQSIDISRLNVLPEQPLAFILGNEVNGISAEILELCDAAVSIQQYGDKHSLNVSVAAGIVFFSILQKLTDQ